MSRCALRRQAPCEPAKIILFSALISPHGAPNTIACTWRAARFVTPRRDFFVVVPREYRAAGCLPASWFIDDLMRHMGRRYYVGLLTAAALHGAGHQQPMAFQVMVNSAERDIEVGACASTST